MISFHNNCVGYRLIFWCFVRPKRKSTPWKRRRVKLLKKPGRALSIQRPLLLLLLHSSIPPLDLVAADLSLLESTLTFCLLNFDQTFCGWLSSCLLCLLTSFFYNVAKLRCLAIISQLCASYSCRVGRGLPASSHLHPKIAGLSRRWSHDYVCRKPTEMVTAERTESNPGCAGYCGLHSPFHIPSSTVEEDEMVWASGRRSSPFFVSVGAKAKNARTQDSRAHSLVLGSLTIPSPLFH